ncbi:SCO2525 family SAM-dependent methyltransferase [Actinoplanes sp. URMC 104]|uniref:SCO2525 family SAM-dependent methyltransferase n=1 Tax=Actinoplanes sp. URMC 104 TaxID=3423409 RepID=UPI003F1A8519
MEPSRPLTPDGQVDWDAFAAHDYWKANYAFMRADDRLFLEMVRDFFGAEASSTPAGSGVDVGSGANLYPAMSMLPLADEITLWEYGAQNCAWLREQLPHYSTYWDRYWQTLREHKAYEALGSRDVRRRLARAATVHQASLFDLPEQQFDVGTMFFVAESITSDEGEFRRAVASFMEALKPGAPFAAAFMRNSTGYVVKDHKFPAVKVDEDGIAECLRAFASDLRVHTVDTRGRSIDAQDRSEGAPEKQLRDGYEGMILALGHRQ